jgi:hypothetical protein
MTMTPEEKLAMARECEARDWLLLKINQTCFWHKKAVEEVAAFTKMNTPEFNDTFLASWEGERDKAARMEQIYRTLYGIVRDRDEWREQHENLLSVRQCDLDAMQERVRAETERCAMIAEEELTKCKTRTWGWYICHRIAAAIRETPHAEG